MTVDTSKSLETDSKRTCTYWVRQDGRERITDPNGEILNLDRLTAYAEYGKKIHDAEAHHELPILKITAPAFLDALSLKAHRQLHSQDSNLIEVDGIPLVRANR